jgi:hypothetical protein
LIAKNVGIRAFSPDGRGDGGAVAEPVDIVLDDRAVVADSDAGAGAPPTCVRAAWTPLSMTAMRIPFPVRSAAAP